MSNQTVAKFLKAGIEGLKDAGVREVVLSPGSRSTPLAILLQKEQSLTTYMDVDERSAAFFALGLAKVSNLPVACVCTSGTAAANYFPAICEAMESHIPLIVLTTDRPHELRHVSAPQTMEQVHLYGDKVKFSMEFPLAEETEPMLQYSYSQMFQLVNRSRTLPYGPVHGNLPFREPLLPDVSVPVPEIKRKRLLQGKQQLLDYPNELLSSIQKEKGWLLVGEMTSKVSSDLLVAFAEKLGWPIFSDSLANLKTSGQSSNTIINHNDLLTKHVTLHESNLPEVVIRIGRPLLSKSLNQFLDQFEGEYLLVDDSGLIPDYSHKSSFVIESDPSLFIEGILPIIQSKDSQWLNQWTTLDQQIHETLYQSELLTQFSEASIVADILKQMPKNGRLFLSNSMPIRDVDTVITNQQQAFQLYGNRGINGIDGIISTAFGMSAHNQNHWNGLLVGDISFFHSLNGLALGKNYQLPLTIFVINNDGGGIFSMLPQQNLPKELFETLFGTPQSLNIKALVEGFNCEYHQVRNQLEWEDIAEEIMTQPKFRVVEIVTSREENTRLRSEMNQLVKNTVMADAL